MPLHVVEELMSIIQMQPTSSDHDTDKEDTDQDELMSVQATDASSKQDKPTMRLQGYIGKHSVQILIDSGSVSSFGEECVAAVQCATQDTPLQTYVVADGNKM